MDVSARQRPIKPRWGPRVPQHKLRRLYEGAARGLIDAELLDDVGFTLYVRCQSILTIRDIGLKRRVPCPACGRVIQLGEDVWSWSDPAAYFTCPTCAWTLSCRDYWATFRHQELTGEGAEPMFEEFVASWEAASSERDKLLAIDRLIHQWHWATDAARRERFGLGRPTGVNLIEGSRKEVIAFLDGLTYGGASPEELKTTRDAWREEWAEVRSRLHASRPRRRSRAEER
jgi:hypothetical protein